MGIPGLATVAAAHLKWHPASFYHGQDLWIDGLNYIHGITNKVSSKSHTGPLADFERITCKKLAALMAFKPRKITFVFDAYVGEKKFQIRLSRQGAKLRRLAPRQVLSAPALLVEILQDRFPEIGIIYAGTEAEDEIMKQIDENDNGSYRQFVWSDDSDLFTFPVRNSKRVFVIPTRTQIRPRPANCKCICLADVLSKVKACDVQPLPVHRQGFSVINPPRPLRSLIEFVNCGRVYDRFFLVLPPIYVPLEAHVQCPYDAGAEIRRATYGLVMCSNGFDPKNYKVTEWAQRGGNALESEVVDPLYGDTLQLSTQVLDSMPIKSIVRNQLEQIKSELDITDRQLDAIERYIDDLMVSGTEAPLAKSPGAWGFRFDVLLKAILYALLNYELARGSFRSASRHLLWRVTPYGINTYLSATK